MLMEATLFRGDVHVDGNKLMDKLIDARTTNTPILNESTTPRRYMLKKDDNGDYFVHGTGTASRRIRLNGKYPVTYITDVMPGDERQKAVASHWNVGKESRKRSRAVA